ncbi:hypothetical protein BLNAU_19972 [Blattamonas nauphoetae]|uniref:Uncharacterized protein n=1 Tax=Blattamonas nauphoetae TaxID=2049346 RepID=A0ABQ9X0M1_9EUKA|nr:hypothetical protein BLNAU_19972 [Blattamonas nauphoetae]
METAQILVIALTPIASRIPILQRVSLSYQKPVISAGNQGFKPCSCFFSVHISPPHHVDVDFCFTWFSEPT